MFSVTDCYSAVNVWSDNIIKRYRKNGEDGTSGNLAFSLKMPRNSFSDMQILVYANGEDLSDVDVVVSPPTSKNNIIKDVYLYFQWYVDTSLALPPNTNGFASNAAYPTGKYPDALIPKVDRFYHEKRNKFPFSVPNGELQGVLVEFGTEFTAAAGNYTCVATVKGKGSVTGSFSIQVPISITVYPVALPKQPSYHAQIYAFYSDIMYAHGYGIWPSEGDPEIKLYTDYQKLMVYHRISNFQTNGGNPTWDGTKISFNWTDVDRFIIPAMKGELITSGPYAGNVMKSTGIFNAGWVYAKYGTKATIAYMQAWFDHFTAAGIDPMTRVFAKIVDEPKISAVPTLIAVASLMKQVNTGGRGVWTNGWTTAKNFTGLAGTSFDADGFYCPPIRSYTCSYWIDYPNHNVSAGQCVAHGQSSEAGLLSGYPTAANGQRWMYNACDSFGCIETSADSYQLGGEQGFSAIDAPGINNRWFSLSMWLYRQTGIHYFSSTGVFAQTGSYGITKRSGPFKSVFNYGVHGDGILMYPGNATLSGKTWPSQTGFYPPDKGGLIAIGGTHDIPLASIRLKYIRDGLEDLELFKMASEKTSVTTVDAIINSKFSNSDPNLAYWHGSMLPSDVIKVREKALDLIKYHQVPILYNNN